MLMNFGKHPGTGLMQENIERHLHELTFEQPFWQFVEGASSWLVESF